MSVNNKVYVCGMDLLSKDRQTALRLELEKRTLVITELHEADAAIYVLGSDQDRKFQDQAKTQGVPYVQLRQEHDQPSLLCSLIGEAVEPGQAAQWAWSLINESEKWHTPKKKECEMNESSAQTVDCHHENFTQLTFLNYKYPSIHGPRTEVWKVKCNGCDKESEEGFIGE